MFDFAELDMSNGIFPASVERQVASEAKQLTHNHSPGDEG